MAQKRKMPIEFEDVSSVCEAESANVYALVANVSPMKKGKKVEYFEGKMTDGAMQMRVVGFQGNQQKKLSDFQEKMGVGVSLENCQVKCC